MVLGTASATQPDTAGHFSRSCRHGHGLDRWDFFRRVVVGLPGLRGREAADKLRLVELG
jgi:hypothetical protein